MYHTIAFSVGLGMVIYGVFQNTKSQVHLRKELLKKYILIYIIGVITCNYLLIPLFTLIKYLIK